MIYVDTSIVLAQLFDERRKPKEALWTEPLIASRVLEYELWVRVHARGLAKTHSEETQKIVARISLVELDHEVLQRAIEPFPVPVRTLDALHLATMDFLREQGQELRLATYDERLWRAAEALDFEAFPV